MKRLAFLLVVLIGCSDSTEPNHRLTGRWFGLISTPGLGTAITLNLVENNGNVNGSGFIGSVVVTVISGTFNPPELSLTIGEGGLHPPANITGGFVNADKINGTVTGSGFTGQAVSMDRQ